jgi:hypothetical protein
MSALHNHKPGWRGRRLWLGLAVILLLISLACWTWGAFMARYEGSRPFVGAWRLVSMLPSHPDGANIVIEADLMSDGSVHSRAWDSSTGTFFYDEPFDARWRVLDGKFQHVIGGYPVLRSLGMGVGQRVRTDFAVTWEGPDRFRLESDHPSSARISVWVRSDRAGHR